LDPKWEEYDFDDPPFAGLEVARQIGMVSYRTAEGFQNKFGRKIKGKKNEYGSDTMWDVKSYLVYQGKKFAERMDPMSYVRNSTASCGAVWAYFRDQFCTAS